MSLVVGALPATSDQNSEFQQDHTALQAIEAQILAGRASEALETLGRVKKPVRSGQFADDHARRIRLEILAHRQLRAVTKVRKLARSLEERAAWATYAQVIVLGLSEDADGWGIWLVLFALAMGVFVMGGGRELLRPHFESVLLLALTLLLIVTNESVSGVYASSLGLVAAAAWVLVHGAVATMARVQPEFRGRLLLGVVLLCGLVGIFGATASKIRVL